MNHASTIADAVPNTAIVIEIASSVFMIAFSIFLFLMLRVCSPLEHILNIRVSMIEIKK